MDETRSVLQEVSFQFALRIIRQYKMIVELHKEFVIRRQLLKAGTAIGAMVREGACAQSKPDFISKMSIALKEANETEYWLLLLKESDYLEQQQADALIIENKSLIRMLTASIKTAKNNLKSNNQR